MFDAMATMKIGQIARLVGVRVDTVRYYERIGLLPAAPRRSSGYRIFDEATVARMRRIRQLQDLGLSLQEIAAMLQVLDERMACAQGAHKIRAALARTDDQIAALTMRKHRLAGALRRCARSECTLLA